MRYGESYAYLVPLLKSSSSSEFYHSLIAVSELDHHQPMTEADLYYFETKNLTFLINRKF
jgi:hypothetical protein